MKAVQIKLAKNDVLAATCFEVTPGEKAVTFAQQFITDAMTYEESLDVLADVIDGNIEVENRSRLRRCNCCGYLFIDITKNNSALICSDDCKDKKDTVLQEIRREERRADSPHRLTFKDIYYVQHLRDGTQLEYPYWNEAKFGKYIRTSEQIMYEYDRSRKCDFYGEDFEQIIGRKLWQIEQGFAKRKVPELIVYDTEKTVKRPPFVVNFLPNDGNVKKPIDHPIVKKGKGEVYTDLLNRYGDYKLLQARRRAMYHKTGNYLA